ncbi:MAG TPA: lysophospholipid acyltransferase family protein [Thermoanaerobaculia bacterium]|nr:lysophospholipid acyltransferase family protein [Thermoanaerobaculia bacterium]
MRRRKSRLVQLAEYAAYRVIGSAVRTAPERGVARIGSGFGSLSGRVLRGRDRLAMQNLRITFPEKNEAELRAILDECWRHFGRETLGYLKAQSLSFEELVGKVQFVNPSLLEEARARGNGTIVISAHYGGWEIAGLAVLALAKDVRIVARVLDNAYLERDLARIRARTGAEVLDRKKAARPLMKALADNGTVVLLPDQAVLQREGVLSPFLGRPAWTTPVPAKLALRHGSTIVFAFCIPDASGHRLEFEEPIRADELREGERDPVALTTRINEVISRRIVARPELWLWMHDRWKGTAESEVADG